MISYLINPNNNYIKPQLKENIFRLDKQAQLFTTNFRNSFKDRS